MNKKDPVDVKSKVLSLRVAVQLNHFLDTRVEELKAVAENKRGLDKSWLMLRLMELGQDWLASWHLGQPTDYEEWLLKEMVEAEKSFKRLSREKKPEAVYQEGYCEGLKKAHELFDKYEDLVCKIGEEA